MIVCVQLDCHAPPVEFDILFLYITMVLYHSMCVLVDIMRIGDGNESGSTTSKLGCTCYCIGIRLQDCIAMRLGGLH